MSRLSVVQSFAPKRPKLPPPKVAHPFRRRQTEDDHAALETRIIDALSEVYDPELPLNVFDLGLIYAIDIDGERVHLRMTLTTPNCPVAQSLPEDVRKVAAAVPGVVDATVEVIWTPPWNVGMLDEEARLALNV